MPGTGSTQPVPRLDLKLVLQNQESPREEFWLCRTGTTERINQGSPREGFWLCKTGICGRWRKWFGRTSSLTSFTEKYKPVAKNQHTK
ncbi:hypothetical protein AGABI1DRAFT_134204 [Agaricus bisporus var. burnettii JB137-S8]|uniref:Uncharacterized protein n=1 Tax=Agaricus bisporus var. burnettii (strain JB137-S8 / ATCC MYA-4627 / FGSC 10392) TaxID=597362 RepID=K5VHB6_AGABU|nr:uncharacterized protein AGABI1DRAFT_134204 [Agaricus bisporus var. burnettii JB137-S8]EKM73719.1 hypothetical protein AGABI1DRAFT_134204 [Agaricus bisporus var. burnettii JB137-S8]